MPPFANGLWGKRKKIAFPKSNQKIYLSILGGTSPVPYHVRIQRSISRDVDFFVWPRGQAMRVCTGHTKKIRRYHLVELNELYKTVMVQINEQCTFIRDKLKGCYLHIKVLHCRFVFFFTWRGCGSAHTYPRVPDLGDAGVGAGPSALLCYLRSRLVLYICTWNEW